MLTERRAHPEHHCGLIIILLQRRSSQWVPYVLLLVLPESRATRLPLVYVKGDQQEIILRRSWEERGREGT